MCVRERERVCISMKHAGAFSPSCCAVGFINQRSDMKLHFYSSSYGCHHYHSKLRHTAPTPTSFITRLLFSLLPFVSLHLLYHLLFLHRKLCHTQSLAVKCLKVHQQIEILGSFTNLIVFGEEFPSSLEKKTGLFNEIITFVHNKENRGCENPRKGSNMKVS